MARARQPDSGEGHVAPAPIPAGAIRSARSTLETVDLSCPSDPLRVLLVEDNPGDAELVREALAVTRPGATLVCVERISEALERAREGEWDVVLLDLSLPDAHELSGARRLHIAFPHLPIVVLTSLDDDRVAARAVAEGVQDYLLKGQIEPLLLVRSIRYAIERHQHAERARQLAEERAARIAAETALAALRESESRFRAVIDQVQDYAILVLDPKGLVASWSTGARLLKGWSPEEILGRSFESFFPPEEVARGNPNAELARAAREGHVESEGWRLRKDGSRFFANVVITALRGEDGDLLGFVEVSRDVTERRRTEQNRELLAQATQEFASALDPIAALDRLAHLAVPWIADLCGVDLAHEDGSHGEFVATASVDPGKEQALVEARRRCPVLPGRSSQVLETVWRGEPVFFADVGERELSAMARSPEHLDLVRTMGLRSFMSVPLRSRGVAYGAVVFAMTEPGRRFDRVDLDLAIELARRAELAIENARLFTELQRAVRVREDVLAVVSHDLKSPLSAIQLAASSALRSLDQGRDASSLRRPLETIQRGTRSAHLLLSDLRDMASIRAGRLGIRMANEDAELLISEAVQAHEALAREKGISLASRGAVAAAVSCDRNRVLQVFSNVIANAIKFCASGDRIDVSMGAGERFATFTVADSGPGIAEDALPLVFEAYWSSAKRPCDGTGLGLFISKGIVEAHGGRMWIESRVGDGTKVRFTIPLAGA